LVGVKGALAQEVTTGKGVICDTKDQAEMFVLNVADPACAVVTIAFIVGPVARQSG
jgi:hypothetical protein